MLAAGTNVQWLRDDLGLIASSDESHAVAAACADSGGVVFVPAPLGLGTPEWDYGARGALFGLTRGNGLTSVLLGDTTLTNMTAIPASAFANAACSCGTRFSATIDAPAGAMRVAVILRVFSTTFGAKPGSKVDTMPILRTL